MIKKKKARKAKAEVSVPKEAPKAPALTQIQRLANLGADYGSVFTHNSIRGIYTYYGTLSIEELSNLLKSPTITALERSIIVHISKINVTSKDSMDALKYLHDRMFGKVETKMELTGANGGAIKVEADHKVDVERSIANMTDEQLAAFEKNMQALSGLTLPAGASESE